MSNRMIPALQRVVHENQTGFLPGRNISTNIRRILDVVMAAEEDQTDAFILSCDYYKCFDVIELQSVIGAMRFFGFSGTLIKWVQIMYRSFRLQVQNNGNFSANFVPTRGLHQGGPASNALFLCVAELLANSIRSDSIITGIYVKKIMNLLNQFADDMDTMMENKQQNLDQFLHLVQQFHASQYWIYPQL